jgi:Flp pilus assembly protein TadG
MVEFAITFPLLLLLAISITDYGYYLEHVDNIATVVRDGARYASLNVTTSPLPWNSACPDPTWLGAGWSCAGLSTTVGNNSSGVSLTSSAFAAGTGTIYVASTTGFSTEGDFFVTTTTNTSSGTGTAVIACTGTGSQTFTGCGTDSYTGSSPTLVLGNELEGTSDFTEGVIQEEAESLTVPEGGLPLDNIDCCWSQASSSSSGCPTGTGGSGLGTTPVLGGKVVIPTSWPGGVSAPTGTVPASCMTISYWNSSDGSDSTSSLSICGWWSSDASSDAGAWEATSGCSAAAGEVVQVTVAYAWSQTSPGPIFSVLNSTFGINVNVFATYSFVVMT